MRDIHSITASNHHIELYQSISSQNEIC